MPRLNCKPLPTLTQSNINRFWNKVEKHGPDDCWPWTAYRRHGGYGEFAVRPHPSPFRSNRLAFLITTGKDPGNLNVLHRCDNPPCCNPKHLFLGTNDDNIADMVSKGRHSFATNPPKRMQNGSANFCSILTDEAVRSIRFRFAAGGITQRELAAEYGVGQTAISRIILRIRWKHI